MSVRLTALLLLSLFLLAGCTAAVTELQAAEDVTEFYKQFSPAGGSVELLSAIPYRNNLLVFIKHEAVEGFSFFDLLLVGKNGVLSLAAAPFSEKINLCKLIDDNNLIIYGLLPHEKNSVAETPAAVERINGNAVITLRNWKIREQEITLGRGFILVLEKKSNPEAINIYDEQGKLLVQYKSLNSSKVQTTELIPVADLPLPVPLRLEEIGEMQFHLQVFGEEVMTCEKELQENIVKTLNSSYPQLKRIHPHDSLSREIELIVRLQDERIVHVVQDEDDQFIIFWQKGGNANAYKFTSEELKNLFAAVCREFF
ncbi:MAG: hypothetical protein GX893_02015 [Firmicutes bacterium]|nr:hypothetical protein [Bacillota bacterium]